MTRYDYETVPGQGPNLGLIVLQVDERIEADFEDVRVPHRRAHGREPFASPMPLPQLRRTPRDHAARERLPHLVVRPVSHGL